MPPNDFSPSGPVVDKEEGILEIWPISVTDNQERKWRYARQSIEKVVDNLSIKIGKYKNPTIYLSKGEESYRTVWTDAQFNAAEYGSTLLSHLGLQSEGVYPKSIWTVHHSLCAANISTKSNILDYFAGSGTTGHAVINLNREDNGNRKYILVEIGHHFETVLLPRMKKVTYSQRMERRQTTKQRRNQSAVQIHPP